MATPMPVHPLHPCTAALWWLYLLLFGAFPYEWSLEMGHLFTGVSALCPSYWLLTLIVPVAACLPTFAAMALKT